MVIALLPLLLIWDGRLGRGDGIFLIMVFIFYLFWLFSKKERFSKIYVSERASIVKEFRIFIKDLGKIIFGVLLLLLAAEGIVRSASFFAKELNLSLALTGILIVGLGNSLPETYFALAAARKGQNWMILGDLMGSIITPSTLVLGIVALIYPIEISNFSPFATARFFLIISALFFLFFVRTNKKITFKEALFLLGIYIAFLAVEILNK
jgi:cation:H+ antiporter